MTRRQRKNLGESLNKATRSMPQREKEMILKNKNFLSSITDLCKSENNLNLLSSKISSILNCNLKEMNKKLMNNDKSDDMDMDDDDNDFQESNDFSESMNASEMDSKLMVSKNMRHFLHPKQDHDGMLHDSISGNDTNDMDHDDDVDDDAGDSDRNSFKTPINRRALLDNRPMGNPRFKDFLLQTNQNLVISKGSKKWISDSITPENDMDDDANVMTQANRDFLAKLISTKLHKGADTSRNLNSEESDENSPILDVVDSNLHHQQQQQHQQENNQFNQSFSHQNTIVPNNNNSMMEIQSQFQNNGNSSNQNTFNPHFNHLGSFYNASSSANRNMTGSVPTSASLLVEAALNSVSNMIGNNEINDGENNQQMNMDDDENHQQDLPDEMTNAEFQSNHGMINSVENNMKMIKSQNFPIHLPSMDSFTNTVNNTNMISDNNEIEVDASSTPKSHEKLCSYTPSGDKEVNVNTFQNQTNDSCSPARTMTPDQHNANYNSNFTNQRNTQIVQQHQTSPVGQLTTRPIYGSEHDLVSPASTPSLPRYDFGSENYRRRERNLSASANVNYQKSMQNLHQQQQQQQSTQIAHISSDEENSIVIAENLSVNHQNQNHIVNDKIKVNSQIDLLYANKYDNSTTNQSNQLHRESLNDLRLKYNEHGLEIQEFSRNSVGNENIINGGGNGSDYQGLDMSSSRHGLGYHPHGFQLSASAGSNLSFNRYQHHIYDILTDREQQAQSQQQQDHHPFQLQQQQQQQIQHLLQDHISHDQDSDQIQSGVDLSRTSNTYSIVPPSPPPLPYSHSHSEMLRMASLDLSSGSSGASAGMVASNNSHHVRHHSSFLSHAPNREISDHHRFLSTADQRLLVDPTAHLLLEQNNRLLSSENNRILDQSRLLSDGPANRHVVSPRGFGAYHHHSHHTHHQVKYHQAPPSNQQQNYHPFSASYY